MSDNRWLNSRKEEERGKLYDARFEELHKAGKEVHGEANFVWNYKPETVLDAGCGTGRVAIELARRGCRVVGVDLDPEMLACAREKAPQLDWREGDLAAVQLGQQFELAVMAGNVILFVSPGTEEKVIRNMSGHLKPGGKLVAGFQLNRGLSLAEYNEFCAAAGLEPLETFATWDREEFFPGTDYVVTVHRKEK